MADQGQEQQEPQQQGDMQQQHHEQPQHEHDGSQLGERMAVDDSHTVSGHAALEQLAAATAAASTASQYPGVSDAPQPSLKDVTAVIAAAAANGAFTANNNNAAHGDAQDGVQPTPQLQEPSTAMDVDEQASAPAEGAQPGPDGSAEAAQDPATNVATATHASSAGEAGGDQVEQLNAPEAVAVTSSASDPAHESVAAPAPAPADGDATAASQDNVRMDNAEAQPSNDQQSAEQQQPEEASQSDPQPQAQQEHGQDPDVSASPALETSSREATAEPGTASSADAGVPGTPKPKKERARPKPRSKSATKITRFRKITSCLQCREKKQKCDRVKPVCGNCRENPGDDPCHFIDEEQRRPTSEERAAALHIAVDSPLPAKRKHPGEDTTLIAGLSPSSSGLPLLKNRRHAHFMLARRQMVDKLVGAGKDRECAFNARINAARAAAIADVLFESAIQLPPAEQVSSLLYTFKTQVELFVNVVITDINMARFQSFLRWWHSKPMTMLADPPLVPLLLVLLALSLQTHRTSLSKDGNPLSNENPVPGFACSSERMLLEAAGRCLDALQIACPSAWSSAFQAPIDLIKASLLRGIWHMNELNLQFAGTCFAVTTRLAYAAGLHRDPKHWSGMRIEEAQARRNLWWNIVFFEVAHAHRLGQPPCLSHEGFDTGYPDDYDALYALYERAGLADPDPSRVILPPGHKALIPRTPTRDNFDYHWARFRIYHIFLRQSQQLFRFGISSPPDPNLIVDYTAWKEQLPQYFKDHFAKREQGDAVRPSDECLAKTRAVQPVKGNYDPQGYHEFESYLQVYNLEFMYHQSMITIHRPYIDEQGAWKPTESVQKSLEVCLNSAEAIIATVSDVLAVDPPFSMFNNCAYFSFNAGLVLAIHCKLDPSSQKHRLALRAALVNLQELAQMVRLGNIAEQAGRYCTTLRQMLQGSGGGLARLAAAATDAAQEQETAAAAAHSAEGVAGAVDPSLRNESSANEPSASAPAMATAEGSANAAATAPATAEPTNKSTAVAEAEAFTDGFPAYLLPFVGLPPDMSNLGPQADYWSMTGSASGLPMDFALPGAGSSQSQLPSQEQTRHHDQQQTDSHEQQQEQQRKQHDGQEQQDASTSQSAAEAASNVHEGSVSVPDEAAAEQYQSLYELFSSGGGGRGDEAARIAELSHLPDRPMSFSQHYNHQVPDRSQQTQGAANAAGNSADERVLGANLLSKIYEQTQQSAARSTTAGVAGGGAQSSTRQRSDGNGGEAGGEGQSADATTTSALDAVAAVAAAASMEDMANANEGGLPQQAQQQGEQGQGGDEAQLDIQEQNNSIAGMWYALENFSQMLNNRQ